jgi:hypothetical protein
MADIFAKGSLNGSLKSEKVIKLRRRMVKIGGHDFALITAHAKLGPSFGRVRETLIQPMKGMTEVADYNHGFQIMDNPTMAKRMTCKWNQLWW